MILGIAIALSSAAVAFAMSGAKSTAYALFYVAFLPFLTLDPSQGGLVAIDGLQGGNVAWKLGCRALAAAGLAVIALRRRDAVFSILARRSSLPILILFSWAVIGLPRAQDPWVSFFRLGELLVFFMTGVVLAVDAARETRPNVVLRWHALALLPVLIVTLAFSQMRPEIAFHESSDGLRRMGHKFMNSNVLGFAAAVVLLWGASSLKTAIVCPPGEHRRAPIRWLLDLAALSVAAYVLFYARSRTATLTTALGLAVVLAPWPAAGLASSVAAQVRQRRRVTFFASIAALLVVALLGAEGIESYFMRGASASEISSGTGRTGLWSDLMLTQVQDAPLLGAGYLNLSDRGGFEHAGHQWNNAHNTYLFALVSTGVPGFLCVLAIVGLPLFRSFQRALTGVRCRSNDPREPVAAQECWALVFALQGIVATASITGFGVIGYPNVAMAFHYGLFAWVMDPRHDQLPHRDLAPIPHWNSPAVKPPLPPRHRAGRVAAVHSVSPAAGAVR